MHLGNMHIQHVSGVKCLITIFTTVNKYTREMDVFNVLSDVAFITAHLPTEFTNMGFWTSFRVLVHVVIQLFRVRS